MELSLTCLCCGEEAFEVVVPEAAVALLNQCHSFTSLRAVLDGKDRVAGKTQIASLLSKLGEFKPVLGDLDEYEPTVALLSRAYAAAEKVTGPAKWALVP